ncbi:integrin alpha [Engelhardtia mirabilis]|uniref:integrin alpha n=1 Tax=Engelhardtia mirabilis TaxID=2528011 RepID=UPI003AF35F71
MYATENAARGERTAGFGFDVTGVGDWDRDGIADAAASAPALGEDTPGAVWVLSGKTGRELAHFFGAPGEEFGYAIAGDLDVDHDGVGDLLVGVRSAAGGGLRRGEVRFFSGRTMAPMKHLLTGEVDHAMFGSALAIIGDLDDDGIRDIAVGAPGEARDAGTVRIHSGKTLEPIAVLRGSGPGDRFGSAIASAGDVNADGREDLIVGAPNERGVHPESGTVRIFNARTQRPLRTLYGELPHERFGTRVAGIGDVTGDGRSEYAVASPSAEFGGLADVGRVQVFDGRSGERRFILNGSSAGDFFGRGLAGGIDVNGDGWPDLIVGSPYATQRIGRTDRRAGALRCYSGVDGALIQDIPSRLRGELLGWNVAVLRDPRDAGSPVGIAIGGPGRRGTPPQAGDPPTRQGSLRLYERRPE